MAAAPLPTNILHYKTYQLSDDAPWMVFIHGAGGSLVTWKHQVNGFKALFNLLLIDMRDHGQSKNITPTYKDYNFDIITDDIINVLDNLQLKQAHFMSLSLGSIVLQKLHERRPDMVTSMIMGGGVFKADWKIHLFAHSGKLLSYIIPFRWIYDGFSLVVMPRKNHQPSRRMFRLQSQKLSPEEFLKWLGLYRDFFKIVKRFYNKRLETASLILVGDQDHVFLDAAKRFALKHAHLAKLVVIERCGHICNIEQAEYFNREVIAFIRQLTPNNQPLKT